MSSIIYAVSSISSASIHEIMWKLPLSLIGHLCAQALKAKGVEGVARPMKYKQALKELDRLMEEKKNVRN